MNIIKIIGTILGLCLLSIILIETMSFDDLRVSDAKWQWVRSKIYDKEIKEMDYAILGSSRLWCSLRPRQMADELGGAPVYNLGVNWFGRDVLYFMVKSLLEQKKVGHLLIEVTDNEQHPDYYKPHAYLKHVLTPSELGEELQLQAREIQPSQRQNQSPEYKKFIELGLGYVAEMSVRVPRILISAQIQRFGPQHQVVNDTLRQNDETFGFYTGDGELTQSPDFYTQYKPYSYRNRVLNNSSAVETNARTDHYLRKIKLLADAKGTKLTFIYHPTYLGPPPSNSATYYYDSLGDFFTPSLESLYKIEYWRNISHLYQQGAIAFTDQVISHYKEKTVASMSPSN